MSLSFNYTITSFIFLQIIFSYLIFFTKKKKYLVILFLLFFSIYLGLRDFNIGADTNTYVSTYLKGKGGYFSEKGFKYLGYLMYKLNFSARGYLLVISLLNTFLYYKGYQLFFKNKINFYLILWIYLFNVTSLFGYINILRQSLAGGFLLIAFGLLNKNKKILSILIFLIGFSFHKSIIFFFFIYFNIFYKLYLKLLLRNKILIILLTLFFSILIPHFLLWHPKFYDYFYARANKSFYLKYILISIFYFYYILKNREKEKIESFIFYNLCILSFFMNFKLLSSRLIYYLNIFIPILLIKYLNKIEKRNRNIIFYLISFYHIIILFYPSVNTQFKFFNI